MRRIARLRLIAGTHAIPSSTASVPTRIASSQCPQASPTCSTRRARFLSTSARRFNDQRTSQSLGDKTPTEEPIVPTEEELAILAAEDVYSGEVAEVEIDQTHYKLPRRATTAEDVDSISDPTYVPATVADGLETVGGVQNWFEKHANYSETFSGFKPRSKVVEPQALRNIVRRAVVEALALKQAGAANLLVSSWPIGDAESLSRTVALGVQGGAVTGDFQAVATDLQQVDENLTSPPKAREINRAAESTAADASWESLQLNDMTVKFAVAKRFFQLSGQRIYDHELNNITDAKSLVTLVQRVPKAKTLSEEISTRRPELLSTPNVAFSAKRLTRGDKDKALGRFKVIEDELRKRNLPLVGHGWAEKNRELEQYDGKI